MSEQDQANTPPSGPDGDGVRVTPKARSARRPALTVVLAVAVLFAVALVWRLDASPTLETAGNDNASIALVASEDVPPEPVAATSGRRVPPVAEELPELPSHDPNDLASYFAPGDPEPTGAELIEALHDMGIRTGIGAFNPPGTSPVLEGIPVPDDYVLPEGYARHHQWTDEGEPISAILMFAPGYTHLGPDGRPIALPDNGVVPPHLAPPGL